MATQPTTSGSKDFAITRTDIIRAALRKCGVLDAQDPLDPAEEADAAFALNLLIKEWSANGIDIFVRQQVTLVLDPDKSVYYLGRVSNDNALYPTTDDLVLLGGVSASKIANQQWVNGNTSIDVTKGVNTNNDPVWISATSRSSGIDAVDDFAVYHNFQNAVVALRTDAGKWITARCTGISSDTDWENVTLTEPMNGETGDVASVGNLVRFAEGRQTASAFGGQFGLWQRPMRILQVHRRDPYSGNDVPVTLIGENEYMRLNRKHQQGATTNVWYQPFDDYGKLHVWPTGDSTFSDLVMQCQFHLSDMDKASDNPQFPIEWGNALIFNLAHDLAPEYGVSREERQDLFTIGQGKLKQALDFNVENANVILTIDQRESGAP